MGRRNVPKSQPQARRKRPGETYTRGQLRRGVTNGNKPIDPNPKGKNSTVAKMVMPVGRCTRHPPGKPGKLRFVTEDDAKRALKQAQQNHSAKSGKRVEDRYYKCDACHAYHLTSMSKDDYLKEKKV